MTWRSNPLVLLAGCLALTAPVQAVTVRVAPAASPTTLPADGPLPPTVTVRSLEDAQKTVRQALVRLRAAGSTERVTVVLDDGRYELRQPLQFGPEDSGDEGRPVVWKAARRGGAVLTGAVRLGPGERSGREVRFAAPALPEGFWAGAPQLFVNGQRALLAREPEAGRYWYAGQPLASEGEDAKTLGRRAFRPQAEAAAFLARLPAEDAARAVVAVMHSWSSGRYRLQGAVRPERLELTPAARWPYLGFNGSQRFFVENVAAAFDAPGEWIGDARGLRYRPRDGEASIQGAELPVAERLLVFQGAGPDGPFVSHLEFEGLVFQHTVSAVPPQGDQDPQAAATLGAMIEADFARRLKFSDCTVTGSGGYGFWFRSGVRDSAVSGCDLRDLGGGGVKIGTEERLPKDAPKATSGVQVVDSLIESTGRVHPAAVGVWIGNAWGNTVARNLIANTTYSGISVGWQWGFGAPSSGDNLVQGNLLVHIGNGSLGDMAGIYTLGDSPGTRVVGNVVRDVVPYRTYGSGSWGIYNDEGSRRIVVEDNVVLDGGDGGYQLHAGRDVTVRGNLFALGRVAEISVAKGALDGELVQFSDNLVYLRPGTAPFTRTAVAPFLRASGVWLGGRAAEPEWLAGCGGGCRASGVRLDAGSGTRLALAGDDLAPARRWAEVMQSAGPRAERVRTLAADLPRRPDPRSFTSDATPPAPPVDLELRADRLPLGVQPPGWKVLPPTTPSPMTVVADPSAPGGRCLEVRDAASFKASYEPYLVGAPNNDNGAVALTFQLRTDPASDLIVEWRDDDKPYRTGPRLRLNARGIELPGRVLPPLRSGEWATLRIVSQPQRRVWSLGISEGNGPERVVGDLPYRSPEWRELKWLGFLSNASVESRMCLTGVEVSNRR